MKISLIEGTTVYDEKEFYHIDIPIKYITSDNEKDYEELKEESDYYFKLLDINIDSKKLRLKYQREDGYKTLLSAKSFNNIFILSLIAKVLEINPLNSKDFKVLLHPNNIYYSDMNTVKFLYRANKHLIFGKTMNSMEQYKLLILSMMSPYSYEQYKKKKFELLTKQEDEFLNSVERTNSVNELHALIKKELYKRETEYFSTLEEKKLKYKKMSNKRLRTTLYSIPGIVIVCILVSSVMMAGYKKKLNNESERILNQKNAYETYLKSGDITKANSYMSLYKPTEEEVKDWYLYTKQYENLLDLDNSYASKVVSLLYKSNNQKELLTYEISNCDYIEVEQAILDYDVNKLFNYSPYDDEQAFRIVKAFLDLERLENAENVKERIKDTKLKENAETLINNYKENVQQEEEKKKDEKTAEND